MNTHKLYNLPLLLLAALCLMACNKKQFHIEGQITDAADSVLYLENLSLNGPVAIDSTKLSADGTFAFAGDAPQAPEFYRLRIAGQIINVAVDSTEQIQIKAAYPTMASAYQVEGSENSAVMKELAILQQTLQSQINALVNNPNITVDSVKAGVAQLLTDYKANLTRQYIFKEPMKAYAYFALFQTYVLGYQQALVFNPRNDIADNKAFAAVATSWDAYHPGSERGLNLHNIAVEGMKDALILRSKQAATIPVEQVSQTGIIDLKLTDNKGVVRKLSDLKGRVVLLDFHLFASEQSTARIMTLRDLYNKYHAAGLEVYQVSLDDNEHYWKTQTAALPWISVRDAADTSARAYNVQALPAFYLIDKGNNLHKRDLQIKDLEAEIKALL